MKCSLIGQQCSIQNRLALFPPQYGGTTMLSIASNFKHRSLPYRGAGIRVVGVILNLDVLSLFSITSTERHYTLAPAKAS